MVHDNGFVELAAILAILIPSIVLHEVAHGWVADRLGDTTARDAGRLTLNPVKHVDPFGSLLLPGMLALAGGTVFGWARPVPVQPARFARPWQGMAIVGLAGPATNLALAAAAGILGPFVDLRAGGGSPGVELVSSLGVGLTSDSIWARMVFAFLVVNCALALFNMLPIPPLDGSRLLPLVLPARGRMLYARYSPYGMLVIFALVFIVPGALSWMGDVVAWLVRGVVP